MPSVPIDLGDLRRVTPIDAGFGGGRGKPIDRHYIERFLAVHAADILGDVLEVADTHYADRFGEGRVSRCDVLHVDANAPGVTVVGDLAHGETLPTARYDCFICTQTLQYVHALGDAIATMYRMLKPGGVLLLTVPGISQISPHERDRWGEHWRFTPQSVTRLIATAFDSLEVVGYGNVLASIGFLSGLACEDLTPPELDAVDDRYPMIVAARATKRG